MSILTFKVKHDNDYSDLLGKAKQVAEFVVKKKLEKVRKLSTADVKQFGLTASISNQIIRKYGNNKKIKKVSRIKLIIAGYFIKTNKEKQEIYIPALKARFGYEFRNDFEKINQIEVDNKYYYISVTVEDKPQIEPEGFIGIDRNTNGHCVVCACDKTKKVMKLGKKAKHIHTKYSKTRKRLQRLKKLKKLKAIKRREHNIVTDLNHQISRKVVNYAAENNVGIKLEDLTGIRNNKKNHKSFHYTLNSWSYYQLQTFIEYKSNLLGIPVLYVDPHYTSQRCSKCGLIGNRNGKSFKCPHCGHTAHADVNAAWNICHSEQLLEEPSSEYSSKPNVSMDLITGHSSLVEEFYIQQLDKEDDLSKGLTGNPKEALS
jgi:putative transposase